jgi:hypothetical protein
LSTELSRASSRLAVSLAFAYALVCTEGCAHRTSLELSDLCDGRSVAQHLELVIDSVRAPAGAELRRLAGHRFDVELNLINLSRAGRCPDRSGEASIRAHLPDELANAVTSRKQVARWRIEGTDVAVDLNPGVIDNNLSFSLPLDGGNGRWSLSTIAGEVASGRLLTP